MLRSFDPFAARQRCGDRRRDRTREHPDRHLAQVAGLLQADAYDGYNRLYLPDRKSGPITEALCWSHARRKFFELADIAANARRGKDAPPISPIAFAAVKRIDALFEIEREINGLPAEQRLAAREASWQRCTGKALPEQIRTFVANRPEEPKN